MNEPTTIEQIRSILAESTQRAERATPGPWTANRHRVMWMSTSLGQILYCDSPEGDEVDARNADFSAAARTDLPARDRALLMDREQFEKLRACLVILAEVAHIEPHVRLLIKGIDENEDTILSVLTGETK